MALNLSRRGLATLAAAASLARPARAELAKIRIGYTPLVEFLGAYAGRERGFFAAHGLDVSFTALALNPTIPPALESGSVEIGAINPAVFLLALDGGLDLQLVAGATVTPKGHGIMALVLRPGVAYDGPASLAGKRIMLPGLRTSVEVLFRGWLRARGASGERITFVEMASNRMPDALRGTNFDGAVIVEPYLTRVVQEGIAGRVVRFADELGTDIIGTFYIAERAWVAANPGPLAAFRAGLAEGSAFAMASEEQGRAIMAPYLNLPPAVVAGMPYPHLNVSVSEAGLGFWINAMMAEGMLTRAIDPRAVIAA